MVRIKSLLASRKKQFKESEREKQTESEKNRLHDLERSRNPGLRGVRIQAELSRIENECKHRGPLSCLIMEQLDTEEFVVRHGDAEWRRVMGNHAKAVHGTCEDIPEEVTRAFEKKFFSEEKPDLSGKKIWYKLSQKEWEQGIKEKENNRAPGADSIRYEFLKALSSHNSNMLRKACNRAIESGKLPLAWRTTLLKKISKGQDDRNPDQLRPIGLQSTIWKVISSTMNRRLAKVLTEGGVLHASQTAFQRDKDTTSSFLTLAEAIHSARSLGHDLHITFLDWHKAYDHLRHDKIAQILEYYQIDPDFVKAIKEMYRDSTVIIEGPGGCTEPVQLKRGIIQGDPLSCLLFVVCFGPLLEYLQKFTQGYRTTNHENIIGQQYVDDLALVSPSVEEARKQYIVVKDYLQAMGMSLNTKKTKHMTNTIHKLGLDEVQTLDPGESYRYLGYWINMNLRWGDHFNRLKGNLFRAANIIAKKCHDWELAVGLINSTLGGMVRYTAQGILIPPKELDLIDEIMVRATRKNINLFLNEHPTRDFLYLPKSLGGMGLMTARDIQMQARTTHTVHLLNNKYDLGKMIESNQTKDEDLTSFLLRKVTKGLQGSPWQLAQKKLTEAKRLDEFLEEGLKPSQYLEASDDWVVAGTDGSVVADRGVLAVFYGEDGPNAGALLPYKPAHSSEVEIAALLLCLIQNRRSKRLRVYIDNQTALILGQKLIQGKFENIDREPLRHLIYPLKTEIERRTMKEFLTELCWIPSHWEKKIEQEPQKWTEKIEQYKRDVPDWEIAKELNEGADRIATRGAFGTDHIITPSKTWFWQEEPNFACKFQKEILNQGEVKKILLSELEKRTLAAITMKPVWGAVWRHISATPGGLELEKSINALLPTNLRQFVIKLRTNLLWSKDKLFRHKNRLPEKLRQKIISPLCVLCNKDQQDTWQHAIFACEHQVNERQRLITDIAENHKEILTALNIQQFTDSHFTGCLPEVKPELRDAAARLQIDIWKVAKTLWGISRRQIHKLDREEETRKKRAEKIQKTQQRELEQQAKRETEKRKAKCLRKLREFRKKIQQKLDLTNLVAKLAPKPKPSPKPKPKTRTQTAMHDYARPYAEKKKTDILLHKYLTRSKKTLPAEKILPSDKPSEMPPVSGIPKPNPIRFGRSTRYMSPVPEAMKIHGNPQKPQDKPENQLEPPDDVIAVAAADACHAEEEEEAPAVMLPKKPPDKV
jgi:hypothetical protein